MLSTLTKWNETVGTVLLALTSSVMSHLVPFVGSLPKFEKKSISHFNLEWFYHEEMVTYRYKAAWNWIPML